MTDQTPITLFSYWSVVCAVELLPNSATLRFRPVRGEQGYTSLDLFDKRRVTASGDDRLSPVLHLLTLAPRVRQSAPDNPLDRELLDAAAFLGPLFTLFPSHSALMGAEYFDEPVQRWIDAASVLHEIVGLMQALANNPDTLLPPDESKSQASDLQGGESDLNGVSEAQRAELSEAFTRPQQSHRERLQDRITRLANDMWTGQDAQLSREARRLWRDNVRPLVGLTTGVFQFNVPIGIQALVAIALFQPEAFHGRALQRCLRPRCRQVVMMKHGQKYCSVRCQGADKQRHYNVRKRQQRAQETREQDS